MVPIKPGMARRLGIRPPEPRPAGILGFDGSMSEQDIAELAAAFREAARGSVRHLLAPPSSFEFTRRYLA